MTSGSVIPVQRMADHRRRSDPPVNGHPAGTRGQATVADRRHPLRLDVLTMTRSAYVHVGCAVVTQVERAVFTLHPLFRGLKVKLDSITPTLSVRRS